LAEPDPDPIVWPKPTPTPPAPPPPAPPPPAPPPPEPAQSEPAPPQDPVPDARPGFAERILPDEIAAAVSPPPAPHPIRRQPDPEPDYAQEPAPPETDFVEPPFEEPVFSNTPAEPPAEDGYAESEYDYSQFDHEPPFRSRRNLLKLWTIAAAIFALFAVGTVVVVSYWGLPEWVPIEQPDFGPSQPDLSFDFPPDQQDSRQSPSGTQYFIANGTVTNNGRETRRVPTLLVKLRDARDRVVFEDEIDPPKRTLAPGETIAVQAGMSDIPRSVKFAEFGWKPS
jgi:hypothetical protein